MLLWVIQPRENGDNEDKGMPQQVGSMSKPKPWVAPARVRTETDSSPLAKGKKTARDSEIKYSSGHHPSDRSPVLSGLQPVI